MNNNKPKALFFSNQGISITGLGVELEVSTELLKQGWEVHKVSCDSCLDACFYNGMHNVLACAICESRTQQYSPATSITDYHRHRLRRWPAVETFEPPSFKDNNELLAYQYEGLDLGRGVLSSLVSTLRDNVVSTEQHGELITLLFRSALTTLLNLKHYLSLLKPDHIYLFNGRFAEAYPIIAYCHQQNIPFTTLEVQGRYRSYDKYPNNFPHSIQLRQQAIKAFWVDPAMSQQAKVQQAEEWFEQKRAGRARIVKNFLDKQVKGSLPENFDTERTNIAIFNSSEDEMIAIREWENPLQFGQNECLRWLVKACKDHDDIHFYLRIHPNLEGIDSQQMREIAEMSYPNLTIILANDPIDTYALMDAVDKVISFGSTTSLEATYWGKPSILLGRAMYDGDDNTYQPQTTNELLALILDKHLMPKPRNTTYPFVYHLLNRGIPFRYFKWGGKLNSTFNGKLIRRLTPLTFWYLLKYFNQIPKWIRGNQLIRGRFPRFSDLFRINDKQPEPTSLEE